MPPRIYQAVSNRSRGAFTLVEMLTVIAIIAVLAGLLFPAIKSALLKAEQAKAQQGVNSLATAIRAYHTEYGKWPATPVTYPTPYEEPTIFVSTKLLGLLRGDNIDYLVPAGSWDYNGIDIMYQGNPRKIPFLEVKTADLGIDPSNQRTNYLDPWGTIYRCRLDTDYDNKVQNPFLQVLNPPDPNLVSAGFLVWSAGPDGQDSPHDLMGENAPVNRDNIKSW